LLRAAAKAKIAVVLGTERVADEALLITALVINGDGGIDGFQDKVQLIPRRKARILQVLAGASSKPGG